MEGLNCCGHRGGAAPERFRTEICRAGLELFMFTERTEVGRFWNKEALLAGQSPCTTGGWCACPRADQRRRQLPPAPREEEQGPVAAV